MITDIFLVSVILFLLYSYGKAIKMVCAYEIDIKQLGNEATRLIKHARFMGSVEERFSRFQTLADQQFQIVEAVLAPSASAAHSKHKSSLIKQIKALEEDKRAILQTILDDGLDVEITLIDEKGEKQKKKISDILANHPYDPQPRTETDPISPKNNVRKLHVVKENDDESSNPEIH